MIVILFCLANVDETEQGINHFDNNNSSSSSSRDSRDSIVSK